LDHVWAFNLAAIVVCTVVALNSRKLRANASVWMWSMAGLLSCFLMTKYSAPIGRLIPKIETGVYSWRMLTLASFSLAMLAGAASNSEFKISNWRKTFSALILLATLAMSGWYVAWPMWRGQAFEPNLQHYNYATMPRGAVRENPPMPPVQLASNKGSITVKRWTPELRQLRVNLGEADQLQFRTRNFAGWMATIDGQTVQIKEGAVENILIDLPAGAHAVTLEFRSTPIRRAANWMTILSFAVLLSIIAVTQRRKL
jgi:hypothetical protein